MLEPDTPPEQREISESLRNVWPPTKHGRWMDEDFEPGLVSVIVPTYNRAHFLVEALDSVWEQTYRPIELLIVDDGSTDDTKEVVEAWRQCRHEKKFKVHYSYQENSGAPAARNLGLIKSRGEYIQYLDSDDVLHPQKLSLQVGLLTSSKHVDCELVNCNYKGVKTTQNAIEQLFMPVSHSVMRPVTPEDTPVFTSCCTYLMKRHLVYKVGPWREGMRLHQDFEYNIRLAAVMPMRLQVEAVLYYFREHEEKTRIRTLKETCEGLEDVVAALEVLERTRDNPTLFRERPSWDFKGRYMKALQIALCGNADRLVTTILVHLKAQPGGIAYRLRLLGIDGARRLLGGPLAASLMQRYASFRLRSSSPKR